MRHGRRPRRADRVSPQAIGHGDRVTLLAAAPPTGADAALQRVAAGAWARDRDPAFPTSAMAALGAAGVLGATVPAQGTGLSFAGELALVRAVARADGSVGRIVDGHLNAVERVALLAPPDLRAETLEAVAAGQCWLGLWGADPVAGEGERARVERAGDGLRLEGTKVFCSGAGGLHAALVVVADGDARRLAFVERGPAVEIDRSWFAGSGLRASESHRVTFHGAPVRALLGGPDELGREPWFGRDAIRTAATWAGLTDTAHAAARAALASRAAGGDELAALAAGRMLAAAGTIDRWLDDAGRRAGDHPAAPLTAHSVALRAAVAGAASALVEEALRAAGSRALATGGALDRAARDLRLFLLQHRLDPLLARTGRASLAEGPA